MSKRMNHDAAIKARVALEAVKWVLSVECEPVSVYPSQDFRQAARRPRHSARAASRFALKFVRL